MKKPMTPEEIKKALASAGYSQSDLATDLELCKSHVSRVIHGTATSYRVMNHIATIIKKPLNEVFNISRHPSKPGPKPVLPARSAM